MQRRIVATIICPSFMTAAMFIILPKIINKLGTKYSLMSPRLYSILFITADVVALIIRALGGGKAAMADTIQDAKKGAKLMLVGIIIQLVAMVLFALLGLEFIARYGYDRPARSKIINEPSKCTGWSSVSRRTVLMVLALGIVTVFVLIRTIYRTAELADGWTGTIIATEKWFNWFDAAPIVVAMFTFNAFHPGCLLIDSGRGKMLPVSRRSVSVDRIEMDKV
ncbi:unnamed protein product [Rhizoctonia solani]|uniref:Uncharacterized protein n=1 Tax=Rhizoctonia solani TaxID=456999 RepID=A0A8H3GJY1_9AGAM|nr:unnamed protein product [Rhizoctonia solani]